MSMRYFLLSVALFTTAANAGNSTLDAAIGGGIGGAAGAAIGNEVGGRDGAIIGGALGGAVGAAVTTDSGHRHDPPPPAQHQDYHAPSRGFCPPGQAKKGRC
jgi:phage tail tape-measure protein